MKRKEFNRYVGEIRGLFDATPAEISAALDAYPIYSMGGLINDAAVALFNVRGYVRSALSGGISPHLDTTAHIEQKWYMKCTDTIHPMEHRGRRVIEALLASKGNHTGAYRQPWADHVGILLHHLGNSLLYSLSRAHLGLAADLSDEFKAAMDEYVTHITTK